MNTGLDVSLLGVIPFRLVLMGAHAMSLDDGT